MEPLRSSKGWILIYKGMSFNLMNYIIKMFLNLKDQEKLDIYLPNREFFPIKNFGFIVTNSLSNSLLLINLNGLIIKGKEIRIEWVFLK